MSVLEWAIIAYLILFVPCAVVLNRSGRSNVYVIGYMQCIQDRMLPIDMDYLKWLASEGDFVSDEMKRVVFYTNESKDTYFLIFHVEGDEWHMTCHVDGTMIKSRSTRYRGEFEVYITEFFREHQNRQLV